MPGAPSRQRRRIRRQNSGLSETAYAELYYANPLLQLLMRNTQERSEMPTRLPHPTPLPIASEQPQLNQLFGSQPWINRAGTRSNNSLTAAPPRRYSRFDYTVTPHPGKLYQLAEAGVSDITLEREIGSRRYFFSHYFFRGNPQPVFRQDYHCPTSTFVRLLELQATSIVFPASLVEVIDAERREYNRHRRRFRASLAAELEEYQRQIGTARQTERETINAIISDEIMAGVGEYLPFTSGDEDDDFR